MNIMKRSKPSNLNFSIYIILMIILNLPKKNLVYYFQILRWLVQQQGEVSFVQTKEFTTVYVVILEVTLI